MTFLFVAITMPAAYVATKGGDRKKYKLVDEFKRMTSRDLREDDEFFFKTYMQDEGVLMPLLSMVSDPNVLQSAYARHEEYKARKNHPIHSRPPRDPHQMSHVADIWFYSRMIEDSLQSGLIRKTEEGLVVDQHMKEILEEFVAFLKQKGALPERDTFLVANREIAGSHTPTETRQTKMAERHS